MNFFLGGGDFGCAGGRAITDPANPISGVIHRMTQTMSSRKFSQFHPMACVTSVLLLGASSAFGQTPTPVPPPVYATPTVTPVQNPCERYGRQLPLCKGTRWTSPGYTPCPPSPHPHVNQPQHRCNDPGDWCWGAWQNGYGLSIDPKPPETCVTTVSEATVSSCSPQEGGQGSFTLPCRCVTYSRICWMQTWLLLLPNTNGFCSNPTLAVCDAMPNNCCYVVPPPGTATPIVIGIGYITDQACVTPC